MSTFSIRAKAYGRLTVATLLVFSMLVYVGAALATDNRVERRASEMPMPDPYLDPAWPEADIGEGLGEHYGGGDRDNVEDIPLDDSKDEQRALEALTGDAPAAAPSAELPPPAPTAVAPTSDPAAAVDSVVAPGDEEDDAAPEGEARDPVEW